MIPVLTLLTILCENFMYGYMQLMMPPTSKKLRGHIGLALSFHLSAHYAFRCL